MRKLLLLFVAIVVFVFVLSFDRWGQKAFLDLVLSSFAPSKNKERIIRSKDKPSLNFPESFRIGTSSSAYQVEGAWDEDGKSPSIWDNFVHFYPKAVDDNSTADESADSYHNFKEDIAALKLVGVRTSLR